MKSFNARTLRLSLLIIALAAIGTSLTSAAPEQNEIRIEAGQTLEIGTDTSSVKSEFSWILTKDRKFQNAQRSRFFQTRPTQPGTYVLDVSVQDPLAGSNDYRAFTIIVSDPSPLPPAEPSASEAQKAILTTEPSLIGNAAYLPPEGGILTIDAELSTGPVTSYTLDLNSTLDSDGDGNPENDRDNADTFNEKSGTPLRFFMLPSSEPRKVWLTVTDIETGKSDRTSIDIVFASAPSASSDSSVPPQTSAIRIEGRDMTATFSADLPEADTDGRELLYEWDFGDRRRSLLFTPTHTYNVPGMYTVTLTVRDITNGDVIFTGSNSVQVQGPAEPGSSSSSQGSLSSVSSSSSSAGGGNTSGSFWSILKVGFIVVLLLLLGVGMYMLFTWIKRKTTGGFEKTFESMEKTIVKSDAKPGVVDVKVEPLKLKKEPAAPIVTATKPSQSDIVDREKSKTDFQSQTRDNTASTAAAGPVPSWLAKASVPAPSAPKPASAPAPKPAPAPAPAPAAPKALSATGPVPDWLKPAPAAAPKPAAPTPAPAPALAPKPTPTPAPTPKPEPVPAPAPKPAPVPAPVQKPEPAPAPTPKAEPAPAPQPKPAPTPAPASAPAPDEKPAASPVSAPAQKPTTTDSKPIQESKPASKPEKPDDSDPTVAIISADSLKK